jgi:succinyl-diaminopimelate desuccinylase
MIDYLEKLVAFHSVSSDQTAVKNLLEYVESHLKNRGLHASILTYDGIHNLYASTTGQKHSRVLLQGHADIVPGGQSFRIERDVCYGRGTYDMLFGIAAFMKLADEIEVSKLDLAIMLSGDEEKGGFHGVNRMLEDGYSTDICILPDAGEKFGSLSIAAKGVFSPTILITGKSHHGSRPWEGDGAAGKLVACLTEIGQLFDDSDRHNSTVTIARLAAGAAVNQGPASAEASLDIRYKDKLDLVRIQHGIKDILERYDGEILSLLSGSDYQLDANNVYVKQFVSLYEAHTGQPILYTKAHGSSDARFFSERNIPVIMCRPDGGGAHGDNEWISIEGMGKFYELVREYVALVATKV